MVVTATGRVVLPIDHVVSKRCLYFLACVSFFALWRTRQIVRRKRLRIGFGALSVHSANLVATDLAKSWEFSDARKGQSC